jgi:hypothetical protein
MLFVLVVFLCFSVSRRSDKGIPERRFSVYRCPASSLVLSQQHKARYSAMPDHERENLSVYLLYYIRRFSLLLSLSLSASQVRAALVKGAGTLAAESPSFLSLLSLNLLPSGSSSFLFSLPFLSSAALLLAPLLSMHYSGYITRGAVRDGLTGAPPEVRQMSSERPWIVAFPRKPRPPIFHALSHPKWKHPVAILQRGYTPIRRSRESDLPDGLLMIESAEPMDNRSNFPDFSEHVPPPPRDNSRLDCTGSTTRQL